MSVFRGRRGNTYLRLSAYVTQADILRSSLFCLPNVRGSAADCGKGDKRFWFHYDSRDGSKVNNS
jgi:hypothetical protein